MPQEDCVSEPACRDQTLQVQSRSGRPHWQQFSGQPLWPTNNRRERADNTAGNRWDFNANIGNMLAVNRFGKLTIPAKGLTIQRATAGISHW